ncbi:M24 family metallopeptidase [Burkholderia alba]|uniref:M24 family metallopeptidase n=1 Tax=Burkholderia alba TaxID=2683677 RepID=UPI002B058698|nr:M24 family metallopeptidase [Burkholderia alba]
MIDRLKYHFSDLAPYHASIADTHAGLSVLMDARGLDALVVTAQDEFLSEYLPRGNNPRYALSAFDGSAGNGLFLSEAAARRLGLAQRFVLFVDGRYHLQAETQCDAARVRVEKLPLGLGIWDAIAGWLVERAAQLRSIGYDALRVSVAERERLLADTADADFAWHALTAREVDRAIGLQGWRIDRPIFSLPPSMTGASVAEHIGALNTRLRANLGRDDAATCFLTCAADDLGYLLNSRGYHVPQASSHLGYLFVLGEALVLFLPEGCEACPVELAPYPSLQVVRADQAELARVLSGFEVDTICYGAPAVNCALPDFVSGIWPTARHVDFSPVEALRASKTPEVLDHFRDAFARSSAAIAETMRWAKSGAGDAAPSEVDLARRINDAYGARSAVALTFTTIAANGPHSAIAHYTAADPDTLLTEGELVLMDSGAYYEGGFATDCTRVVLRKTRSGTNAQPWQKEIYTVALKAAIKGLVTHFPAQAKGHDVDDAVRSVCRAHGYDFAHGTGHGIGIHVHEGGVRFSPGSPYGLVPGAVISVEPGIYLAGKGGVRIENVVIIHPCASEPGKVEFENIVSVGYDWDLIDLDLLTGDERDYLRDYERACVERGTAVTACPLL